MVEKYDIGKHIFFSEGNRSIYIYSLWAYSAKNVLTLGIIDGGILSMNISAQEHS